MAAGDVEVAIVSPNALAGASFDGVDDVVSIDVFSMLGDFSWYVEIIFRDVVSQAVLNQTSETIGVNTTAASLLQVKARDEASTYAVSSLGAISPNIKYGVLAVYDKTNSLLKFFLDGVSQGTDATAGNDIRVRVGDITFGANTNNGNYGEAVMSNIRFFSRALSQTDATNFANGDFSNVDNLIHSYPLKDDYADVIGNNDGTNAGSILGIYEEDIAAEVESLRVQSTDTFLMAPVSKDLQVALVNIEELPPT